MSNSALVSIIIPAYNVEKYISHGIESCLNQTYSNIEIVIVDDGSTDGTWKIIEEYQKIDARIIAEHKSNGGVSSARNRALGICKGDYLLFLDSDDWLVENTVEILLNIALNNEKYLACSECYCVYFEEDNSLRYEQHGIDNESERLEREEALLCLGKVNCFKLQSSCYKLFEKSIIDAKQIRFDESIHHGEDGLFTFEYLKESKGLVYEPVPLWNILERPGSATTSPYNSKWLTAITAVEKMLSYEDNTPAVQNSLKYFLVERTIATEIECVRARKLGAVERRRFRKVLRENMDYLYRNDIGMKRRVQFMLLYLAPKNVLELMLQPK